MQPALALCLLCLSICSSGVVVSLHVLQGLLEGSLMQRSGESFDAACPRLVFAVPEYMF
jgi:hypothetical protein